VKLRKLTLLRSRLEWSWFAARLRRAVGLKGASTFLSRKLQNPGDEGDGEKDFSLLAPLAWKFGAASARRPWQNGKWEGRPRWARSLLDRHRRSLLDPEKIKDLYLAMSEAADNSPIVARNESAQRRISPARGPGDEAVRGGHRGGGWMAGALTAALLRFFERRLKAIECGRFCAPIASTDCLPDQH
jgi:hypothetical protein